MLKEIRYNFKSQPVIAAVTVAGTALSILLVMVVVMTQQISVAPFSPESGRDRFLHYRHISFGNKEWGDITESNSNGPMNLKVVKSLFYPLETPEAVTAYAVGNATKSVGVTGDKPHSVDVREVDDRYFNVFDFTFVDGKPFTRADFDAELPLAVIDSNVARKLFGTENASGKEFNLNGAPYRVSGVVKPVSPLASNAYSQVWPNLTSTPLSRESWSELGGGLSVTMLAPDTPTGMADVRDEFNRRLDEYQKEIGEAGWGIVNRNRPYTQEKSMASHGANVEPDEKGVFWRNILIYTILLLVPAINLSSMTQSRLRRRVSEIAIRRAFGQTRMSAGMSLVAENMVITLAGGVLGLLMAVAVAFWFADALFAPGYVRLHTGTVVEPSMLLQWSTFGLALLFCFILNLLSSALPAWRMSRVPLVESLKS